MQNFLKQGLRRLRLAAKKRLGHEPIIALDKRLLLERHGSEYGGWKIPGGRLDRNSAVIDIGLGEDVSFSQSLISRYGCTVHGFEPTPRSIAYVERLAPPSFVLHKFGISARSGKATFHLPNDERHVSGSLVSVGHVGQRSVEVELLSCGDVIDRVCADRIDLMKMDVEGAEYDVFASDSFRQNAHRIDMICVEFHHRWDVFGPAATERAVSHLRSLGFACVWCSPTTNEEFTFVRASD
ncbi:MAG: hypothetical protein CTY20_03030 [Hyphomicrobium sp.]|nr:MAG: hypothetical protein CTY20_03030 [Hyphomicrobium sp.]